MAPAAGFVSRCPNSAALALAEIIAGQPTDHILVKSCHAPQIFRHRRVRSGLGTTVRSARWNAAAVAVGAGAGLILLLSISGEWSLPGSPTTIIPPGVGETIPGFQNVTSTTFQCPVRCGSPGELWFPFSVAVHGRLWGSLRFGAPVDVWVGNPAGIASACGLADPPPPCASPLGPAYLFKSPPGVRSIDFGGISFEFDGSSLLPSGDWSILLINWNAHPVAASAGPAVTVHPTW